MCIYKCYRFNIYGGVAISIAISQIAGIFQELVYDCMLCRFVHIWVGTLLIFLTQLIVSYEYF